MTLAPIDLSIIVPAYNEVGRIAGTLQSMKDYLDRQGSTWEIIVSADGDDGTREAASAWGKGDERLKVIGSPRRLGKGRGIRVGVELAWGNTIGFIDADYKTPIEEIAKVLPFLSEYDIAIGSRKVGGARVEVAQRLYRRLGSKAFHAVMGNLLGLSDIADTQCGFKFFRRDAAKSVFSHQRIDGYMFDVEILRLARLMGLKNARELLRIRMMQYPELRQTK
jgi:dolichyl-phosphate beta-glucosyltransferase